MQVEKSRVPRGKTIVDHNHIHPLVSIASKISVASFMEYLKGKCVRFITAWSQVRTLPGPPIFSG